MTADVPTLTRLINTEVLLAMGLQPDGWLGRRVQPVLSRATQRFAEIFSTADHLIADEGMVCAAHWVLLRLVQGLRARGIENIPPNGPLVIAANHPGAADSVAIGASAGRDDLKILASDVPFLKNLSQIGQHLIFLPRKGIHARMLAMREGFRHLDSGGALLIFPRGTIDPDPAFMPDAEAQLDRWSRSLALFLAKVPTTRVVTSIVSHVVDPNYMHHPLTWLKRGRVDRQRLAIMIQIIQQMMGKKLDLEPRVSFGEAIDWPAAKQAGDALNAVVLAAKHLLHAHLAWQA
ncbi:MAG TPA: 1-acyl-sn-glycerol-3-phosphate acyltransferase [Anaerolineales bacterium]|nr:1-acyl-sn-glycerol-3-phosphate acyltransferase [Anaerolineales bacterium]